MIPKIIHYCWFGRNPLPKSAKKCIASWRKYLPDYEIKEWNEDNFDVNIIPYTAEAYKLKKYAFVSDYARFWILYKYGGLYFDTDVEIICPMDDIIARGNFMGQEKIILSYQNEVMEAVNPGLGIGAVAELDFYKEILTCYGNKTFLDSDGKITETVVTIVTQMLSRKHTEQRGSFMFVENIYVYPPEYFCPIDYFTGEMNLTSNTRSIHHYSATWLTWYEKAEKRIFNFFGVKYHGYIKRYIVDKLSFRRK